MGIMSTKSQYICLVDDRSINDNNFYEQCENAIYKKNYDKKLAKKQKSIRDTYISLQIEHNAYIKSDTFKHDINIFCNQFAPNMEDIIKFVIKTGHNKYNVCTIKCIDYRLYFISDKLKGKKIKLKHAFTSSNNYNILTHLHMSKLIGYRMYDAARTLLSKIEIRYIDSAASSNLNTGHETLITVDYILDKRV